MKSSAIVALMLLLWPAILIAQPMGGWGSSGGDWDLEVGFFILIIYPLLHLLLIIVPLARKGLSTYSFVVARLVVNLITIVVIITTMNKREDIGIMFAIALPLLTLFSISNLFTLYKMKKLRK